jgi:hypothetical protein
MIILPLVSGPVKMYDLWRFENVFVNSHARCVARLGRAWQMAAPDGDVNPN